MRLVGIIAVFVLTVAAIVEGAFLVRLSGQVDSLAEQVRSQSAGPADVDASLRRARTLAAAEGAARMPVPRLDTKAAEGAPPPAEAESTPATAVLREALASAEGRAHLKGALDALNEQQKQQRLTEKTRDVVQNEEAYRQRLTRVLSLGPSEQSTITQMYSTLESNRQRIINDMNSGLKTAEQADDEIDNLEDKTETAVEALLGDTRVKQLRDARRAERQARRTQRWQAQQAGGAAQPAPTPR